MKWRGVTMSEHNVHNFQEGETFLFQYSLAQELCFGGLFGVCIVRIQPNFHVRFGRGGTDDIER